jgi:type 1 glutamine amidotransferase
VCLLLGTLACSECGAGCRGRRRGGRHAFQRARWCGGQPFDSLQSGWPAGEAGRVRALRSGKGFVGIHAASDTEYDWPWYGGLVGAYFREHPTVQAADVVVEDTAHPATLGLPNPWRRSDEWYAFKANPRRNVHVLLSLDESSYSVGSSTMNGDHPVAWCHEYDGGRAFYTALGHTSESLPNRCSSASLPARSLGCWRAEASSSRVLRDDDVQGRSVQRARRH